MTLAEVIRALEADVALLRSFQPRAGGDPDAPPIGESPTIVRLVIPIRPGEVERTVAAIPADLGLAASVVGVDVDDDQAIVTVSLYASDTVASLLAEGLRRTDPGLALRLPRPKVIP